jgi:hypothetical protein
VVRDLSVREFEKESGGDFVSGNKGSSGVVDLLGAQEIYFTPIHISAGF